MELFLDYDYNNSPVCEIEKEKQKEYKRNNQWLKNRLEEFLQEPKNQDVNINKKIYEILELININ